MASEHNVLAEVLLGVDGLNLADGRPALAWILRTQGGKYRHLYDDGVVYLGFKGLPDAVGQLSCCCGFTIETKAADGQLRKEQISFRDDYLYRTQGKGLCILARSADDATRPIIEHLAVHGLAVVR